MMRMGVSYRAVNNGFACRATLRQVDNHPTEPNLFVFHTSRDFEEKSIDAQWMPNPKNGIIANYDRDITIFIVNRKRISKMTKHKGKSSYKLREIK